MQEQVDGKISALCHLNFKFEHEGADMLGALKALNQTKTKYTSPLFSHDHPWLKLILTRKGNLYKHGRSSSID
jgi:hypothetical protein